jgi:antibiotic biosynthesis monooxygenase (ABM) superfamily enzyme
MTTTTANTTTANTTNTADTTATAPVSQHRQALTVWLAVLPTLTVLQLVLGDFLTQVHPYLRPPIMATVAVPIVVYGVMPRLARLTARVARG